MSVAKSDAVAAAKRILLASRCDVQPPADDRGTIAAAKRALAPNHTDPAAWRCDGSDQTIEVCDLPADREQQGGASRSVTLGGGSRYVDNTPRVDFSPGCFNQYGDDLPEAPTVLMGAMSDWLSMQPGPRRWTVASLASRGIGISDSHFSVDGGPAFARMSLADARVDITAMCEYVSPQCDCEGDLAPLYVFDPGINKRTFADGTPYAEEFCVPECFSHDTMSPLQGSVYRPLPPGWLLVGGQRSGTPIHDHPHTVAWNALLDGTKLWVCLPPDVDPKHLLLLGCEGGEEEPEEDEEEAAGEDDEEDGAFDLEAMAWFQHWNHVGGEALPSSARVIVQQAGEVVFVPAGWWHVVLNCSSHATVALSHSLGLRRDFEKTWPLLLQDDVEFANVWRSARLRQAEEEGE